MSAQRKAAKPRAAPDVPPTVVTSDEVSLLKTVRATNDRSQGVIGRVAENQAERCPRRVTPALRLIAGGKS